VSCGVDAFDWDGVGIAWSWNVIRVLLLCLVMGALFQIRQMGLLSFDMLALLNSLSRMPTTFYSRRSKQTKNAKERNFVINRRRYTRSFWLIVQGRWDGD